MLVREVAPAPGRRTPPAACRRLTIHLWNQAALSARVAISGIVASIHRTAEFAAKGAEAVFASASR